jgi:hypothetical protein
MVMGRNAEIVKQNIRKYERNRKMYGIVTKNQINTVPFRQVYIISFEQEFALCGF